VAGKVATGMATKISGSEWPLWPVCGPLSAVVPSGCRNWVGLMECPVCPVSVQFARSAATCPVCPVRVQFLRQDIVSASPRSPNLLQHPFSHRLRAVRQNNHGQCPRRSRSQETQTRPCTQHQLAERGSLLLQTAARLVGVVAHSPPTRSPTTVELRQEPGTTPERTISQSRMTEIRLQRRPF